MHTLCTNPPVATLKESRQMALTSKQRVDFDATIRALRETEVTFLDLLTLAVLLPFLFWLNAPLAWVVCCAPG